jgi:hypothetical protein
MQADGRRSRGRSRKTWRDVIEDDLKRYDLRAEDAMDRCMWRGRVYDVNRPTQVTLEKNLQIWPMGYGCKTDLYLPYVWAKIMPYLWDSTLHSE